MLHACALPEITIRQGQAGLPRSRCPRVFRWEGQWHLADTGRFCDGHNSVCTRTEPCLSLPSSDSTLRHKAGFFILAVRARNQGKVGLADEVFHQRFRAIRKQYAPAADVSRYLRSLFKFALTLCCHFFNDVANMKRCGAPVGHCVPPYSLRSGRYRPFPGPQRRKTALAASPSSKPRGRPSGEARTMQTLPAQCALVMLMTTKRAITSLLI